jgi:UDP-N-acetylglucosamine/UDP-N-acetylgalactosamine diphosphorylase
MKQALEQLLAPFGQQHLLAFWDELNDAQRQQLADDIRRVDFAQLDQLVKGKQHAEDWAALAARAKTPPAVRLSDQKKRDATHSSAVAGRASSPSYGRVGAILVAGGQGTRLGFSHPKGMFPVGPVSGASLFQILIEKLIAAGRRTGASVPLYLMTSTATHDETIAYLDEHDRFGLPAEDLHVFCQGQMPAVEIETGRVLLDAKNRLALGPDGHGGMLAALAKSGGLDDMQRRGLQHIFYFQVDNPLAQVCDPLFLSEHERCGSEMSSQVVGKRFPLERVGNVAMIDGRLRIIEYSDLPEAAANERNADGSLKFWAGSIAVHVFAVEFLRRMQSAAGALPFHVARKKVPFVDAAGQRIEPTAPNAIKFERFIFDLLPAAERYLIWEVDPADAFAPLKNAAGEKTDTLATTQAALIAQHARWLEAAGATVAPSVPVEISPLFALGPDDLRGKIQPGLHVTQPTCFC